MWALTIEDEEGVVTRVELAGATYSMGRDPACDICLADRNVSRLHATLRVRPEGDWEVVDEDSLNGCFLNGRRVRERARLGSSDALRVGDYSLRVFDGAAEAAGAGAGGARARGKPDRLVVLEGAEVGRELRLDRGPLTIGGGVGSQLELSDQKLRFLVRPLDGRYEFVNVGQRADLLVNFAPAWRKLLDDGDRIEVPGVLALRFVRGERSGATEPPPSRRARGARREGKRPRRPASTPPRGEGRKRAASGPAPRLVEAEPPSLRVDSAPPPRPSASAPPPRSAVSVPAPRLLASQPPSRPAAFEPAPHGPRSEPPRALLSEPPSPPTSTPPPRRSSLRPPAANADAGAVNTLGGQVKGLYPDQGEPAPMPESLSKLSTTHGALIDDSFQYPSVSYSHTHEVRARCQRSSRSSLVAAALVVAAGAAAFVWQSRSPGPLPRASTLGALPTATLVLSLEAPPAARPAASAASAASAAPAASVERNAPRRGAR
jgi:FHA domain-containing protein